MTHPAHRHAKHSHRAKHHKLGVEGEYPQDKARRLCGGRTHHEEGGRVDPARFPGVHKMAPSHIPNPEHLKGD
jgi:hypothetical protein